MKVTSATIFFCSPSVTFLYSMWPLSLSVTSFKWKLLSFWDLKPVFTFCDQFLLSVTCFYSLWPVSVSVTCFHFLWPVFTFCALFSFSVTCFHSLWSVSTLCDLFHLSVTCFHSLWPVSTLCDLFHFSVTCFHSLWLVFTFCDLFLLHHNISVEMIQFLWKENPEDDGLSRTRDPTTPPHLTSTHPTSPHVN